MKKAVDTNAITEFKTNIENTKNLIESINRSIKAGKAVSKLLEESNSSLDQESSTTIMQLKFAGKNSTRLYNMGFIELFANFEFFMFSFLKEKYEKYPAAIGEEKFITWNDLNSSSSIKKLKQSYIEKHAKRGAYEIAEWNKIIKKSFGIIILNQNQLDEINVFSKIRNALLHSGGNLNNQEILDISKSNSPQYKSANEKECFENLFKFLSYIADHFNITCQTP